MQTDRFKILLAHYLDGSLSPTEWDDLSRQLGHHPHSRELRDAIDQVLEDRRFSGIADKRRADSLFSDILQAAESQREHTPKRFRMTPYRRASAAAAVLILLLGGGWLYYRHSSGVKTTGIAMRNARPVGPGGNKAVLILSSGAAVVLDSARNGKIASQGNTQVVKHNGLISYQRLQGSQGMPSKVFYNTVVTPRGGVYEVLLPDSSKAWLNAASSLRFPTAFQGKSREVTLTGEAYFEIANKASQPFIVHISSAEGTPKGEVQVLGTHFNINAYDNEAQVRTTLLEGKIRMTGGRASVVMTPGDETDLDKDGALHLRAGVDTVAAVAWKNGLFLFRNTDIRVLMRQIARWYDVEVNYAGGTQARLSGIISRNTELTQVLHMLELTREVHFRTDGKIVTVTP